MRRIILVIGLLLVAVSAQAAWILPNGRVVNSQRRLEAPDGRIFKQAWFSQPERLKEYGVKYWRENRGFDERYYKSTGYTDIESSTPDGVGQIIRTHTFEPRYTIEQGRAYRKAQVIEIGQAVVTQQVKNILFDAALPTANMLSKIEAVKSAARTRRLELNAEIDALTTYEEIIQYTPQWTSTVVESGVTE